MKVPGQEENIDSSQLGMSNVISNDSDSTIVEKSAALAIDRSGSGEPGESSQTLPAQRATGPRTREGKQRSRVNALRHGIFSASALIKGESRAAYDSLLDGLTKAKAPAGKLEEVLVEILAMTIWRKRRLFQAEAAEIQKGIDLIDWELQIRKSEEARRNDLSLLMENEPGLFMRTNNPFALKRCLDLLAELRDQIAENGFTDSDLEILKQLYGSAHESNLGDNLHDEYLKWAETAGISKAERLKEGYATPRQCKYYMLEDINREIRRLKEYQKVEVVRRAVPESPALERLLRYDVSLDRSFDRTLAQLERLQRLRLGQPVPPRIDVNISSS